MQDHAAEVLTDEQIVSSLAGIPGWTYVDGKLHRELKFHDFIDAFGFMTKAAMIAESRGHHPEWRNVYNSVTIDLSTHEADGVTRKDIDLADAFNRLTDNP